MPEPYRYQNQIDTDTCIGINMKDNSGISMKLRGRKWCIGITLYLYNSVVSVWDLVSAEICINHSLSRYHQVCIGIGGTLQ